MKTDGCDKCWGWDVVGQAAAARGSIANISAEYGHTCGVKTDGSVKFWGTDAYLFRDERAAESQMDDLEEFLDDQLSHEVDIEEVRADGEFVLFTIIMDEDNLIDFIVWMALLAIHP